MASTLPPVKGVTFNFPVSLVSQGDTDVFQTTVTITTADVWVSKDGGAFAAAAAAPTELLTGGAAPTGVLWQNLTAAEMTADVVTVLYHDAAGAQWQDALVTIYTAAQHIDDLAATGAAMTLTAAYDAAKTAAQAGNAMTLANDSIKAATFDETTAFPLKAADAGSTYVARTGADSDTLETLSDQIDSTLTGSALAAVSALTAGTINVVKYTDYDATISGLTIAADWAKIYLTAKEDDTDAEANALLQIQESTAGTGDGLLRLEGAAYATAAHASLTVDQSAGTIVIHIAAAATSGATERRTSGYDIKQIRTGGQISSLGEGEYNVYATETQSLT